MPRKRGLWKRVYSKIKKIDRFIDTFSFVGTIVSLIGLFLALSQTNPINPFKDEFNHVTSLMVGTNTVNSIGYQIYITLLGIFILIIGGSIFLWRKRR